MSRYENYEIKNNVFGTLSAPISSLATTIQLWDWQGQRFSVNQLATLENIENWKVVHREIVLITAISWDVLTVTRKYAPCPTSDDDNSQWQVSYAFGADDTISVYIDKEHFDKLSNSIDDLYDNWNDRLYVHKTWWLWIKVMAWNVRIWNTDIQFPETIATVNDNSTNYLMISDSSTLNIATTWRDDTQAKIATVVANNWEITSINMWKVDTVWWKIETWWSSEVYVCWETITKWDLVAVKDYLWWLHPTTEQWIGTTTMSWYAMKVFWNWVEDNDLNAFLCIAWTWQDIDVRIETDNAWMPSWTLVNANATARVLASNLTTTMTLVNIPLWWAVSLELWTPYRITFTCSWSDDTNYAKIWLEDNNLTESRKYVSWAWSTSLESQTITVSYWWQITASNEWKNLVWYFEMRESLYVTWFTIWNATTITIKELPAFQNATTTGTIIYTWWLTWINIMLEKWKIYAFLTDATGSWIYSTNINYSYPARFVRVNVSQRRNGDDTENRTGPRTAPTITWILQSFKCVNVASWLFSNLIKKIDFTQPRSLSDTIWIATSNWTLWTIWTLKSTWLIDNDNWNFVKWQTYFITSSWLVMWDNSIRVNVNYIKLWTAISKNSLELNMWFNFASYVSWFYTTFSWYTWTYSTTNNTSYASVGVNGMWMYFAYVPFVRWSLMWQWSYQFFCKNL